MNRAIPTFTDGSTPLNMVQPCHLIMVRFTPLWVEITYKITLSINMDNINRFFAHPKQFIDDSSPDNQFLDGLLSPLDYYKIKFRLTSFDTKSVQVCNITLWLRYWLGICWGTAPLSTPNFDHRFLTETNLIKITHIYFANGSQDLIIGL